MPMDETLIAALLAEGRAACAELEAAARTVAETTQIDWEGVAAAGFRSRVGQDVGQLRGTVAGLQGDVSQLATRPRGLGPSGIGPSGIGP